MVEQRPHRQGQKTVAAPRRSDPLDALRARFREAAETLKRLPLDDMPAPLRAIWPHGTSGSGGRGARAVSPGHMPVAPERIDRLDEVLRWSLLLEPGERRIVWGRALSVPWKVIAAELGLDRTTCWRRHDRALAKLALHLASGACDDLGLRSTRVA